MLGMSLCEAAPLHGWCILSLPTALILSRKKESAKHWHAVVHALLTIPQPDAP